MISQLDHASGSSSGSNSISITDRGLAGHVERFGRFIIRQDSTPRSNSQFHYDERINPSIPCQTEPLAPSCAHVPSVADSEVDVIWKDCPPLSILIMIVGSRGDIQAYIALGKRLKLEGHRVRVATHVTFRDFVTIEGLEFFNIGGNPVDLMSYMVKNPGLVPGFQSLINGDIRKNRIMVKEMVYGCWKSCYAPSTETGRAFIADAIISNPSGFAHIHCAEALGIPLQMSFTMPWSPTTAFPHPLVNIASRNHNARFKLSNYLTYFMVNLLTWEGLGTIINKFRKRTLHLKPLDVRTGPSILEDLEVPWTYCISPVLVPKPGDWGDNIDVVGFYFLDLATNYHPHADLVAFLDAGEPPIYIGFGSVVVDDPQTMTRIIFEATAQAGVRALVSAGWGELGDVDVPSHIFLLGNVPHDWLFDKDRVAAVVHHGGAGTTAIGLANGRPTIVVPFFGDQGFWGNMIHQAGAGPKPIPHRKLTVARLRNAIQYAMSPSAKEAANKMAEAIQNDNGVENGVNSFYRHLPLLNMQCDLDPSRLAVWMSTRHRLKLSAFAAQTLASEGLLKLDELNLHRTKDYDTPPSLPLTGGVGCVFQYVTGVIESLFSPVRKATQIWAAESSGEFSLPKCLQAILVMSPVVNFSGSGMDISETKSTDESRARGSPNFRVEQMEYMEGHLHRTEGNGTSQEGPRTGKRAYIMDRTRKLFKSRVRIIDLGINKVNQKRREVRLKEGVDDFSRSSIPERLQIISAFRDRQLLRSNGQIPEHV